MASLIVVPNHRVVRSNGPLHLPIGLLVLLKKHGGQLVVGTFLHEVTKVVQFFQLAHHLYVLPAKIIGTADNADIITPRNGHGPWPKSVLQFRSLHDHTDRLVTAFTLIFKLPILAPKTFVSFAFVDKLPHLR